MKTPLRLTLIAAFLTAITGAAAAQVAVSVPVPLLPASFGAWKTAPVAAATSAAATSAAATSAAATSAPLATALSLVNISKDALEECQPQRSQVTDYSDGARTLHVEAIEFIDRTGAVSAYTLVKRKDMEPIAGLGSMASAGDNVVLVTVGDSIALVSPATAAEISALKPLVEALPKVFSNKGVAPLLPALIPQAGLVRGSMRYALGGATYAAEGGVLPAAILGWDKEAEAVTADYKDKRGEETLTLLLYPTPALAGNFTRVVQAQIAAAGAQMANARVRREGDLVIFAEGSFDADQAQKMVENVHHKEIVSMDQDIQPSSHQQVVQVYGLLTNIAVLAGVLMLAAVLLGLFLGGGRAIVRKLQGKSAATEPEFLSLHLDNTNKAVYFDKDRT
jgi:hypothetical protein